MNPRRTNCRARAMPIIACALAGFASCASPPPSPRTHDDAHAPVHAIHRFAGLISSSAPRGDAAFDQLASMGVRTIISVDGSAPDVAGAEARAMRYVHIPVTYATITDEQRLELARAVRDLPGPVFIHCHHGKHRGPAAAAAIAVTLGRSTPQRAIEFMRDAGTAPSYHGLYACVRDATEAGTREIDAAPDEFPSVRRPIGITAAMVEIDLASEHLALVRRAGWRVPADQPDLVPAAEAGRLADALRASLDDPVVTGYDLRAHFRMAIEAAAALEEAIVANEPARALDDRHDALARTCAACHARHRD